MDRPAGYERLRERHPVAAPPWYHASAVSTRHRRGTHVKAARVLDVFPSPRWPGERDLDHLVFALKYDGVDLATLRAALPTVTPDELQLALRETPTSGYLRRLWYLYEHFAARRLDLPDLDRGNYVPLLDPAHYYTAPARRSRRHRVDDNVLGDLDWCPVVRRTERLCAGAELGLQARARQVVEGWPPELLARAIAYLFTKETRASYLIEREVPGSTRVERFVALLREAERLEVMDETTLLRLQNVVVDPRFADNGLRTEEVYVGETASLVYERVHFVAPRVSDLGDLMDRWISLTRRLVRAGGSIDPVVLATVVGFAFVYIHPFTDGNGRLHRFLIHWVLARTGFSPRSVILPVSAAMLRDPRGYDDALEVFSTELMRLVEYTLHEDGRAKILNDTVDAYRYIDLTVQAEHLYKWVQQAIDVDLAEELELLDRLDEARARMRELIELPDRLELLFLKLCKQNGWRLSARKRSRHFSMLDDSQIEALESAVRAAVLGDEPEREE